MSLELEWLGIAEGAVFDSRKALSLVGINQNIVRVGTLPAQWQTTIIVMAADDSDDAADGTVSGTLSIEIKDPSNETVSSTKNKLVVDRPQKEVPGSVVAAALVGLQLSQLGRYSVTAELTPDAGGGSPSKRHKYIYVISDAEDSD